MWLLLRELQVKPSILFNVHDCISILLKKWLLNQSTVFSTLNGNPSISTRWCHIRWKKERFLTVFRPKTAEKEITKSVFIYTETGAINVQYVVHRFLPQVETEKQHVLQHIGGYLAYFQFASVCCQATEYNVFQITSQPKVKRVKIWWSWLPRCWKMMVRNSIISEMNVEKQLHWICNARGSHLT